jgi:hypothetical protein
MTQKPDNELRIPRTDKDHLSVAEEALSIVETELRALDRDNDDLAYLAEVLRLGVRRALHGDGHQTDLSSMLCGGPTH